MIPLDLRNKISQDAYWICRSSIFEAMSGPYNLAEATEIHHDMKERLRQVSMLLISVSERVELAP